MGETFKTERRKWSNGKKKESETERKREGRKVTHIEKELKMRYYDCLYKKKHKQREKAKIIQERKKIGKEKKKK